MFRAILTATCAAALAVSQITGAGAQGNAPLQGTAPPLDEIPLALPAGVDAPPTVPGATPPLAASWVQTHFARKIVAQGACGGVGPTASHLCVTVSYERTMEPAGQAQQVTVPTSVRRTFRVAGHQAPVTHLLHPLMGCPSSGCGGSQPTLSEWNCTWSTKYDGTGLFTLYSVGECQTEYYNWYTSYSYGSAMQVCSNLYNSVIERFQCEQPYGNSNIWNPSICTTLYLQIPPYAAPQAVWTCGANVVKQTTKIDELACYLVACSVAATGTAASTLTTYPKNGYWYGSVYETDNFI